MTAQNVHLPCMRAQAGPSADFCLSPSTLIGIMIAMLKFAIFIHDAKGGKAIAVQNLQCHAGNPLPSGQCDIDRTSVITAAGRERERDSLRPLGQQGL